MRTRGVPMLGHGRIYDFSEELVSCEPFEAPDHFFVIDGCDFGYDHPQAQVQLLWDKDSDTFYVSKAWKARNMSPAQAWGATKNWSENVPTAWPQDGLQTEKGSSKQLKEYYIEAGFNMLQDHATWPDGGNGVEVGLMEMRDLMVTGRFKVFAGLPNLGRCSDCNDFTRFSSSVTRFCKSAKARASIRFPCFIISCIRLPISQVG